MRKKAVIALPVIAVLIVSVILTVSYLDSHPWVFGGVGTPDVIWLSYEYRLEKVIAFRNKCFVTDIRDGRVLYVSSRKAGARRYLKNEASADIRSGAVDLGGNEIVPSGSYGNGLYLSFDDEGEITADVSLHENSSAKPVRKVRSDAGEDLFDEYYNFCGVQVMSVPAGYDRVLAVTDGDSGDTVTLFTGSGGGGKWQLSDPVFYNDLVVVRIYHGDCVYRLVRASEPLHESG